MNSMLIRYLPTFHLVAQDLSFSATARRLGLSPAAVSKTIKTLEEGLGVRLFHRSTHALRLTDEGAELHAESGRHVDALERTLSRLASSLDAPRGVLRVAAPSSVGRHLVLPLLAEFRQLYPEIVLDLRFDEAVVDLVKEGIDVAIGSRVAPNDALIARQLFEARAVLVASPQFVEEHGAPECPEDILRFPCIGFRLTHTGKLYPFRFRDPATGSSVTVDPACVITASNLEIIAELAAAHHGLAINGIASVQPYLQAGTLVQLLPEYSHEIPPVKVYYSSSDDLPHRSRVFVDFIVDHLTSVR